MGCCHDRTGLGSSLLRGAFRLVLRRPLRKPYGCQNVRGEVRANGHVVYPKMRRVADAGHEAAHIVVGSALGMRMRKAVLEVKPGWEPSGGVWFDGRCGTTEAWGLMLAAGVAWELVLVGNSRYASGDISLLRAMGVDTRDRVRALSTAAAAMLTGLGPVHARVTRALVDHDLTGAEIAAIGRGERLSDD